MPKFTWVESERTSNREAGRWVSCDGLTNLRDLGGYESKFGGATRWQQVYRSDTLHNLTPDGIASFQMLGIGVIFDLRRDDEREREPGPLACVHHEVAGRRVFDTDPLTLRTRQDGERWLLEDYEGMLRHGGSAFGALFSELARLDRPSVLHCTGGKDRTGMAAALLLLALGVDHEVVLDDYELTALRRGPEHVPPVVDLFVSHGIGLDAAEGMLSSPRWAIAAALDLLDTTYGGVDAYLREHGGMSGSTLGALRTHLLE